MAGRYGRKYATKDDDFDEGEVWGVMEEGENNSSPKLRKPYKESNLFTNSSSSPRHFSAARMIPRSSSSSSTAENGSGKQQSSAPVDIPDWSKIYGNTSKKKKNGTSSSSLWAINYDDDDGYYYNGNGDHHYHHHHHHNVNGYSNDGHYDDDDDGDEDDDIDGMVPPHEYLARKFARNQISSFSVYEGIGRTLKGRDLSKVRNTILSKTGFLE